MGRGLADLIPVGGGEVAVKQNNAATREPAQEVSLTLLHPNPQQPRKHFDEAALAELAASIKANGVLQPVLVRPRPGGRFEIVAGERRYRAAVQAGLAAVPVVVRDLSDDETLALSLIENLIREDIRPLESARAFRRLMDDFGMTQEEVARRVGKSRPAVANAVRLLHLPQAILESLEQGDITEGHARALLGDSRAGANGDRQLTVWRAIRAKGVGAVSVREVERLMQAKPAPLPVAARPTPSLSTDLAQVEDRLRGALGMKLRVSGTEKRGRVEIEYFSEDELDGLVSRLAAEPATAFPPPPAPTRGGGPIHGLLGSRRPAS